MNNNQKTKNQLIEELKKLQRKVKRLEKSGSELKKNSALKNENLIKQNGENISAQELDYKALVESSLDAICVMQESKLIMVNPAWEKLFGYSRKLAYSKYFDFMKIVAPSCRAKIQSRLNTLNKGVPSEQRYEFKGIISSGEIIDIEASMTSITWNGGKAIQGICRDISERNKIVDALKREAFIFDNLNDAIIITDLEGNILNWNSAATKMYGFTKEEVLDKPADILNRKEVHLSLNKKIIASIEKEGKWIGEVEFIRKDGVKRLSETVVFPYFDSNGEQIALVRVNRDITEKKKAQEELQESKRRYEELADLLPQTVFEVDLTGKIIFVNQASFKMFGYTKEEFEEGLNLFQMISPNQASLVSENFLKRIKGENFNDEEYIAVRKDGSSFPILAFTVPINKNGKITGLRGFIIDITERKQTEEQLRKLSRAVEQSPSSIIITNIFGDIEYVNPYFSELTGYNKEEVINKNPRILKSGYTSTEDYKKMWEFLSNGKKWSGEFLNKKKNGELYWESATISPIIDSRGKITHYLAIKEDITEKKKVEKELILAKEKAEESDRLKSEFLAQMSHEIRSPINVILSYNSFLKEELEDKLDSSLESSFTSIDSAGKRLLRTIDLILNMAAMQTGYVNVELNPTDISSIIAGLVAEFEFSAKNKNIELSIVNLAEGVKVPADDYIISEIFQNLIGNSVKYTTSGKIEIKIYSDGNSRLLVDVKDTGIGISEEYLPKLFIPFSQEEMGYSRKYEGNGLGLALVKKYIDLLGAEIKVESKKGEGSTFTVIFHKE